MSVRVRLLFWAILFATVAKASAEPPNVVLIIGDDQAWTDYGFMGHAVVETPHLDRLADEGLVYLRGYVPTSLCRPSLASIITGLYPHQHGIVGNDPFRGDLERDDPEYLELNRRLIRKIEGHSTLPGLLAGAGYRSFQSGKWWEGHFGRGGFTDGMTEGDPAAGGRHGDKGLAIGREGLEPIHRFLDEDYGTPFFLWYAPFLPHTPHNPPERILSRYFAEGRPVELARYYAMCEWFDETVGELLQDLEKRNLRENTIIIYLADNGWIQRTPDHRVPSGWRFSFAPGSKRSPYEGGVRTPIIVNWKGRVTPGSIAFPVSSLDIFPTVLRAAGIEYPKEMAGVDLLDREAVRIREAVFGELFTHDVQDLEDPLASLKFRWCIEADYKLIVPHQPNLLDSRIALYDVVRDPDETVDLSERYPTVVRRLYQRLQQWWPVE